MTHLRSQAVPLVCLLACFIATPARATEGPRTVTHTSGPAIGLAFPLGAGLAGLRADYYFQFPASNYRLAAHAGVGALLCLNTELDEEAESNLDCHPSFAFGLTGSWGIRSRIYVEAAIGTFGGMRLQLHRTVIDTRPIWGSSLLVGYEFMAHAGFFFRGGLGISLLFEPALFSTVERLGFSLTLIHIGYKLW